MASLTDCTPLETCVLYTCKFVGWVWNTLTILPWYFISGNYKVPRVGQIQAKSVSGLPDGPYRCITAVDELSVGCNGVDTLDELFKRSCQRHGTKKCMGTRQLIAEEDEVQPNGRVFKKVIMGDYEWMTYDEAFGYVKKLSSGLQALGVEPKQFVTIFAETKAEWMLAAQACFHRNFPVVTIYATLGDEALLYGFNEVESKYVVTDAALLPKLKNLIPKMKHCTTVIYFGEAKKSIIEEFPKSVSLYSLGQVIELGSKLRHLNVDVESPSTDDVAVIMYTSGSTGVPKGVIITHKNIVTCLKSAAEIIVSDLRPEDKYIGYLPLAHIMELICECACLTYAIPIGYSSALTLSDQSSKIKRGSKGDVSVLKPTLMVAVPMIMERMRSAVLDKIKKQSRMAQLLFKFAYDYKLALVKKGYDTPILNRIIFKKVTSVLGGNIRLMLSGGAPLSAETEDFMNVAFCCPVGQGYGLTETCGGCAITEPWDKSNGRVGHPLSCAEIKLETWEEGGYTVHDKPHPRGEVLISGAHIATGYYNQPEKTAEAFVTDENGKRWFYTGDIGIMHTDGVLKIIDRKKDLVKLCHGEYISLGKVEGAMNQSKYIDNCCVYGDSQESYVIVLIVPHQQNVIELGKTLGEAGTFEELCANKKVIDAVAKDVVKVGTEGKLNKSEIPRKVKLCTELWTPESELVTAAFKLKRKNIQSFYQSDIERLYLN